MSGAISAPDWRTCEETTLLISASADPCHFGPVAVCRFQMSFLVREAEVCSLRFLGRLLAAEHVFCVPRETHGELQEQRSFMSIWRSR
jgi:hypothetical protein